jgi:FAD/FMN-containing dehydrogenase
LQARLRREIEGDVLFGAEDRGRYSTDASIYQIEPLGVVVPRTAADAVRALEIAAEAGVPLLPRGAGTSQCGQTVGAALVLDTSKHLRDLLELDVEARTTWVEPGLVLDDLNARLRPHGLWYPVDVSTSAQATLGGMTANNSCGARSIRYGNMVHNVRGIDALLADGTQAWFGEVAGNFDDDGDGAGDGVSGPMPARYRDLVQRLRALHRREADEIARRFPQVLRRVGGYNIDSIDDNGHNMARLLVGSEGTLAFFNEIELDLQPIPAHRVLGICHFPTFYSAMASTRKIVELGPSAVELVDRTMIDL